MTLQLCQLMCQKTWVRKERNTSRRLRRRSREKMPTQNAKPKSELHCAHAPPQSLRRPLGSFQLCQLWPPSWHSQGPAVPKPPTSRRSGQWRKRRQRLPPAGSISAAPSPAGRQSGIHLEVMHVLEASGMRCEKDTCMYHSLP